MAYKFDSYTKRPVSAAQYVRMRGVTDHTNAAQFNIFESGYSFLFIVKVPEFLKVLAEKKGGYVTELCESFYNILEYEFKGLEGIEDITADTIEVTDNISTINVIGKVNKQSATEVTMSFTEKSGSTITKFIRLYLEGIKDPRSQAKTYHGLIEDGVLAPGFENEVFTLFYIVTDNTMLQIEQAYLLLDAYPNASRTSIYNSTKGEIEKKDIDVTFNCFVLDGEEVNKRALQLLTNVMGKASGGTGNSVTNVIGKVQDQSTSEAYGVAREISPVAEKVERSSRNYEYAVLDDESNTGKNVGLNAYVTGDGTRK